MVAMVNDCSEDSLEKNILGWKVQVHRVLGRGAGSPGLSPGNHWDQSPSCMDRTHPTAKGSPGAAESWAKEAVLSGPPPQPCPAVLPKIWECCT